MTMPAESLYAALLEPQAPALRLQTLVNAIRGEHRCGAVGLLKHDGDQLRPLAVSGLIGETLGRRFKIAQHPRLAAILAREGDITGFDHDSGLPDPYDGLLDSRVGEPLPVHDCMGMPVHLDGRLWGLLTLDALEPGTFDDTSRDRLRAAKPIIEAVLHMVRMEEENQALKLGRTQLLQTTPLLSAETQDIVAESPPMRELLKELDVVAVSDLPVLLQGETGVGKDVLAKLLHRRSERCDAAWVQVNCAALPESLAESELFGHARGAFSGATADRPGRFEAADGGTLLLDEVGELPPGIQAKLLRALQNGEIQRLGDDRVRRVNVRIVAATNRDLREAVKRGQFRADLYHRLSVYPIHVPPLRSRGEDIILLAGRFLEENRARFGLRALRLNSEATAALRHYAWPGNVRELEHVISRAVLKAVSQGAKRTDIITLPAALLDVEQSDALQLTTDHQVAAKPEIKSEAPLRQQVDEFQRQVISSVLARCADNRRQAARQLGLDPSNLLKLCKRLGITATG